MDRAMNILLVEDSPSDIRLTQEALKDTDIKHFLSVVTDGEAALDFLLKSEVDRSLIPDLILLDLNMPKKNGHEVLSEIKAKAPWLDQVPVILITVSQDEQDILRALHVKMNYYVCKPITSDKLSVLLQAIKDLSDAGAALRESGLTGEDAHVRYVMAGNPHTSPSVLDRLAGDARRSIRACVAENPHTPAEALLRLAKDSDPLVRAAVAENANLPANILEELVSDSHDDVRLGLASNPGLPERFLKQLSADGNTFVADRAARTLKTV
jgi:two-component system, chemotaxis family, response regulator Rcp1